MTPSELMGRFAERTGLAGAKPQRRYLWTDAFAVCNLLGLGRVDEALALIDRVHDVLGRHRDDDARRGWISGLSEADGRAHPTLGGLRIGKPNPERTVNEPFDDHLEWERDGQYFHYLTKWMHALDQTARVTGNGKLATWARELADTAHRQFRYESHGTHRLYWKMSIDLMRPLVTSTGQHDPLDGYVTCAQLLAGSASGPDLTDAKSDFRSMIEPRALATADPLGIGGLLFDASRLSQLDGDRSLREAIVAAARVGLEHWLRDADLGAAEERLAFRELGLAIGLAAVQRDPAFKRFARVREAITGFWADESNRRSRTYREHEDINDVMLATSLAPDAFIVLSGNLDI